jgi:pentatricopeptide repeat protein
MSTLTSHTALHPQLGPKEFSTLITGNFAYNSFMSTNNLQACARAGLQSRQLGKMVIDLLSVCIGKHEWGLHLWTALMYYYVKIVCPQVAISVCFIHLLMFFLFIYLFFSFEIYDEMQDFGITHDKTTNQIALQACSALGTAGLVTGQKIHATLAATKLEQQQGIRSSLINMYAKCGDFNSAINIFDCMLAVGHSDQELHEVALWNSVLSACGIHGFGTRAIDLFSKMQQFTKPNEVTFVVVLNACAHSGLVDEALQFYSEMYKQFGVMPTEAHQCCIVDVLTRAGRLAEAENFILQLPSAYKLPSFVMWITLLGGCRLYVCVAV